MGTMLVRLSRRVWLTPRQPPVSRRLAAEGHGIGTAFAGRHPVAIWGRRPRNEPRAIGLGKRAITEQVRKRAGGHGPQYDFGRQHRKAGAEPGQQDSKKKAHILLYTELVKRGGFVRGQNLDQIGFRAVGLKGLRDLPRTRVKMGCLEQFVREAGDQVRHEKLEPVSLESARRKPGRARAADRAGGGGHPGAEGERWSRAGHG